MLDELKPTLIVQGGASGADSLAKRYAKINLIECVTVEADWNKHGKAAGPLRNKKMLEMYPDALVVAFPGGRGTTNCVTTAKVLGLDVMEVDK